MKQRCYYQSAINYNDYGGRGIAVCGEWQNYEPFRDWALPNGYAEDLTIDRINYDGNYCPENCRWLTIAEQQKNKRMLHTNKTGQSGVNRVKNGNFMARITIDEKRICLGTFPTLEQAIDTRQKAEIEYLKRDA